MATYLQHPHGPFCPWGDCLDLPYQQDLDRPHVGQRGGMLHLLCSGAPDRTLLFLLLLKSFALGCMGITVIIIKSLVLYFWSTTFGDWRE